MYEVLDELEKIKDDIATDYPELSSYQALDIAVKVQMNKLFADAHLLGLKEAGALERIAMELIRSNDSSK